MSNQDTYLPIVEILENQTNIFKTNFQAVFSSSIDFPRFEFGFQHFYHADKGPKKTEFDLFKNKKKVYYVLNEYEREIDNYNDDIEHSCQAYFKNLTGDQILTRSFHKYWEMFQYFDLINQKKNISTLTITNSLPSPTQALIEYRKKIKQTSDQNDIYFINNLENKLADDFIKKYKVDQLKKVDKKKYDLLIIDCGVKQEKNNQQEQVHVLILLDVLQVIINNQVKGGNLICKFYETYTIMSLKIIAILRELYKTVHFVKPLMSRYTNAEKYLICTDFKDDKLTKEFDIIQNLNHLIQKNKTNNITNIFKDFKFSDEFKMSIINTSNLVSNKQSEIINKMITYVQTSNYHGDVYAESKEKQIKAAGIWKELFLKDNLIANKDTIKMVNEIVAEYNKKTEFFVKTANTKRYLIINANSTTELTLTKPTETST